MLYASCASLPAGAVTSTNSGYWGSTSTWNGAVPGPADAVTISVGNTVTITNGAALTIKSLTLRGTLTHAVNGTSYATVHRIDLTVTEAVTIQSSGKIDVTIKGYAGGSGSAPNGYGVSGKGTAGGGGWYRYLYKGVWRYQSGGGGGCGGEGGIGNPLGAGGLAYGSVTEPTHQGSGGGGTYSPEKVGGAGGGAVKLTAASLTVNGSIIADGGDGLAYGGLNLNYGSGGGSGGSIWISTGSLTGSGPIQANGGVGGDKPNGLGGGGGGGGRIAVYYTSGTVPELMAQGGTGPFGTGGAGTVYVQKGPSASAGALTIDNNRESGMNGTAGTWADNAYYASLYVLTLHRSGILKHAAKSTAGLNVTAHILTIDASSAIHVAGRGYAGGSGTSPNGYGPGGGGWAWDSSRRYLSGSGAGYGGIGGNAEFVAGGVSYGARETPTYLGSGGGGTYNVSKVGGAGGGAVKLTVDVLTVDGSIVADGIDGQTYGGLNSNFASAGGAGGSIWIIAPRFFGSGAIHANGGAGGLGNQGRDPPTIRDGGGGGGGRIAVYHTAMTFNTNVVTASGGGSNGDPGDAGTIYYLYVPPAGSLLLLL